MVKHYYRLINNTLEYCFNVELDEPLDSEEEKKLAWLLAETFEPDNLSAASFFIPETHSSSSKQIIELGPRLNFATAWNTNALSICSKIGLTKIKRIERSRLLVVHQKQNINSFYDRMTELVYLSPLKTFKTGTQPEPMYSVPLVEEGLAAFDRFPELSMDKHDRQVYYNYFVERCGRNPTIAEILDLNNANSEHSRHGYFKGKQTINGVTQVKTLLEIVQEPWGKNSNNSLIAFSDNSSAIQGNLIVTITPELPGRFSRFQETSLVYHFIFTAETHNFPSGIAPFPGAETGTGGRIRDVQATGRGGLVIAGTAGYCVGNLYLPEYLLPWEKKNLVYPKNLATPLKILIQASNGASDYGNKFGEPVIQGFTRSGALHLPKGERREWLKPIMFTGGIGQIAGDHLQKEEAVPGMLIVQIGGPAYRIGFGGGAASSKMQGENKAELDFNAVQRGDAEMEQKMNRVIRACVEMGKNNPIISLHDQGAGGPANVLKELVEKTGGEIDIRNISVGDPTMSVLEIWVAEYQERNGLLIKPYRLIEFQTICQRERVNCEVLGKVRNDGKFIVHDSQDDSTPINLDLKAVLGGMPQKTFESERIPQQLKPLKLPPGLTVSTALKRVFRLTSVGSKRFLTNKVDRSVTGLIAQQQCCGPLQITVADVAVVAQSHFPNSDGKYTGAATAIGEQPLKMLVDPRAGARMSVAEALTNLVWAKITKLEDVKCSANWMGAPKLPGEGSKLYDAAQAMSNFMIKLGIAVDGGKDSLSMATKVNLPNDQTEIVKSPLELVISAYCGVPDISKVTTPDIKCPGRSRLMLIDLSGGHRRLGGSALAQVFNGQIGQVSPDIDYPQLFKRGFEVIQSLIENDLILSGHDVSDGGLITTLLEMLFAGNCGFDGYIACSKEEVMLELFAEEANLIVECLFENEKIITSQLRKNEIPYRFLGETKVEKKIKLSRLVDSGSEKSSTRSVTLFEGDMRIWRSIWEETSYQLETQQCDPDCAGEEWENNLDRSGPVYIVPQLPHRTRDYSMIAKKPKVAIIREEGSNGDREMTSAFYQAGFDVYDVNMSDLLLDKVNLEQFRGIAFVGGFSYADVLDSAKGWAAVIRYNEKLKKLFDDFYRRFDTFSLGVCNGCQLSTLLGWVPWRGTADQIQPRFIKNKSGRFESRFLTVKILPSPAIMLENMAGSVLGIWSAHGEGRFYSPDKSLLKAITQESLAPIRYVDDSGEETTDYPFNPNGSPLGVAGLCDPTGRHLAMMSHPERTFLSWQWAWWPEAWKDQVNVSPWLTMFQNARAWCERVKP